MKRHVVIGTAGHIDHGKTTLVKALTGMDTDRLKEEKERGMTIDLGFAFLGDEITIIDVPGHERFVRNMVAGVSTIDLVLLVIAADDGIMPQTIEHLEILNLLQIKQGIIVISKIDLVDQEWLELVSEDVKELVKGTFLEKAPIVYVSGITGAGVEELKKVIGEVAESLPPRQDKGVFRLPIDRVFTMRGFGTVVAGTVLSGHLTTDSIVELLPQGKKLRVRGLQIHGKKVDQVKIGDRAAINLVGIEKESIKRGHVLAEPDFFKPTRFLDAKLYLLKDASKALKHNTRVRLHLGTSELMARTALLDKQELVPGDAAFVQFRLEQPVATDVGDRFVIRSYSPVRTIGGGLILQVHPRRHKRFSEEVIQYLATIEEGNTLKIMEQTLLKAGSVPMSLEELTANTSLPPTTIQNSLAELIKAQKVISIEDKAQPGYLHVNRYQTIKNGILTVLEQFHKQNPLRKGLSRTELKTALKESVPLSLFNKAIAELETEKKIETLADRLSLISHQLVLTSEQEALKSEIEQWYLTHRFTPPNTAEVIEQFKGRHAEVEEMIAVLMEDGLLVKLEEGMLMHRHWIDEARNMILHHFQKQEELTISDFRQMVNSSRKYAVPLLGYFDQEGLTIRQQDVRVLNPKSETLLRELKP